MKEMFKNMLRLKPKILFNIQMIVHSKISHSMVKLVSFGIAPTTHMLPHRLAIAVDAF